MPTKATPEPKPGPAADTVKRDGNWQDAIEKSMGKKKPKGEWPKAGK